MVGDRNAMVSLDGKQGAVCDALRSFYRLAFVRTDLLTALILF